MAILPAAIGIIFNEDHTKVLLVKRRDIPVWVLPGGGIESYESPEECVVREVKEETGLDVEIVRKSGEYTPQNKLGALTFVFVCRIKAGTPELSSETSDIHFFSFDTFPDLFFRVHRNWLDDALNNSRPVKKPLVGISYKDFLRCLIRHPICTLGYLWTRFMKN